VAAFNLYPSTRGSELDDISSSAIQVLDHAPLHRAPVRRVTQRADQLHGKGFGLAGHGKLVEGCQLVGKVVAQRAEHKVGVLQNANRANGLRRILAVPGKVFQRLLLLGNIFRGRTQVALDLGQVPLRLPSNSTPAGGQSDSGQNFGSCAGFIVCDVQSGDSLITLGVVCISQHWAFLRCHQTVATRASGASRIYRNQKSNGAPPLHACSLKGDPVAQFLMSWLVADGRFRISAINGIGRRKGRIIEVEVIATGERFHGSARRMERLVQVLRRSSGEADRISPWTPDRTS
jgi:hypothetical protein